MRRVVLAALVLAVIMVTGYASFGSAGKSAPAKERVRIGFLPSLTHPQAVIGLAEGTFQQALGEQFAVEAKPFNAGPSIVEALFAGELDLAYLGPSPAVNGYVKSKGEAFQVIAGAANGGVVLVVQPGLTVRSPADLAGKRVATPQLGNTQDIALRHYLQSGGLKPVEQGGTVRITPMAGAEMVPLFRRKELDAAWVPEPWGARLVEAGGVIALDERELWPDGQFATTLLIASRTALQDRPQVVEAVLSTHIDLTRALAADPAATGDRLRKGLERWVGKPMSEKIVRDALSRITLTYELPIQSVFTNAERAHQLGFLGKKPVRLDGIFHEAVLGKLLAAKGTQ